MQDITLRSKDSTFTAVAAFDTIASLWNRIEPLVNSGRRMVYTERYLPYIVKSDFAVRPDGLKATSSELKVVPGLGLFQGGIHPGARYHHSENCAGFTVTLAPALVSIGASSDRRDGTETDLLQLFRDKKAAADGDPTKRPLPQRRVCLVEVNGFGQGPDDHILMTIYNEFGVGKEVGLYFDLETRSERAERDAAQVDLLAAEGDWTHEALTELAADIRFSGRPLADRFAK